VGGELVGVHLLVKNLMEGCALEGMNSSDVVPGFSTGIVGGMIENCTRDQGETGEFGPVKTRLRDTI
jgi:hypothetical protein